MYTILLAALLFLQESSAPPPEPLAARVEAHAVFHSDEGLTVRVPADATYAGGERFTLYGVADCEIHVFVEADGGRRIRRLYWIQFESYLPSQPDARYDYGESDRRMTLWGAAAWQQAFIIDTARTPRAGSDTERVRAIVERAGYVAPPHFAGVRLVRLLDDPGSTGYGRRELMLIYGEDLAESGTTRAELTNADGTPNARWTQIAEAATGRAATRFRVEARQGLHPAGRHEPPINR